MIEYRCPGQLPGKKCSRETQYSTVKRRSGMESVPFLALDAGEHIVRFYTDTRERTCKVKTWYSPRGWAWIILEGVNGSA